MSADLTPQQRLAISRAQWVQTLRDPVWVLLLRWLQNRSPSTLASVKACAIKIPTEKSEKESG